MEYIPNAREWIAKQFEPEEKEPDLRIVHVVSSEREDTMTLSIRGLDLYLSFVCTRIAQMGLSGILS